MEANKIIITGAATRIGAAIAKSLSGPDVEIVIHYNNSKTKAEKLKRELIKNHTKVFLIKGCLLYTSPSPRDATLSRMPSSA